MLNKRLRELRDFTQQRLFKKYRHDWTFDFVGEFKGKNLSLEKRAALAFKISCEALEPIVFPDEKISFVRTVNNVPAYYEPKEAKKTLGVEKDAVLHPLNNLTINWEKLLNEGLSGRLELCREKLSKTKDKQKRDFLEAAVIVIEAVANLAERYEAAAEAAGNHSVAESFRRVPLYGAKTLQEAMQSIRLMSALLYYAGCAHIGLGRMDQYLYPFYLRDLQRKTLTKEQARDLFAEFFISFNRDSDTYFGVQQGDNGQTVMLGGCDGEGNPAVNELTYLMMEVSKDLKLIDPKINLRIDRNTPDDLLKTACMLTECGLGFPQYSNDEVVIPALVKNGYSLEDARNYTVAACWEFVIPSKGVEIVNKSAVSFPYAVHRAFKLAVKLPLFSKFLFRQLIKWDMWRQIRHIQKVCDIHFLPCPLGCLFVDGALEQAREVEFASKYHHVGIHGAGSSNAADMMTAIEYFADNYPHAKLKELYRATKKNFCGYEELKAFLKTKLPKLGNNDAVSNRNLKFLFDSFALAAEMISTRRSRIRPGSGSAMFYILLTQPVSADLPYIGASEDGRGAGEPLSASLAPAHGVKINGVLSVLKSFAGIDYSRIVNGGPITIELSPTIFKYDEGISKLVNLIKYFVHVGNQQLQLNVLDAAVLEDAMAHPENHRNLIVRVWGWSGYFTELAPEYQRHVLNRHKYTL